MTTEAPARARSHARWEDALDAQLEAYLFATSERGQRYLDGWTRSVLAKHGELSAYAKFMRYATSGLAGSLFNAEPIHVDPDMQTLWEGACPGFVEEALHESDVLTESGFVYLPRPHHVTDVNGNDVSHRAFLWHPVTMVDDDDGILDESGMGWGPVDDSGVNVTGRGLIMYTLHRAGDRDAFDEGRGMYDHISRGIHSGDWLVDGVFPWAYGKVPQYEGRPVGTPMTHDVQVLFRLLLQTIAERQPGRPTRPVRRRCKRYAFPERSVVIVRLRRPNEPTGDGEHSTVEWSHRWLVSGHWRNQWFPSLGVHRQIYISPFVKGPADKPLEVRKTRIFDWSR